MALDDPCDGVGQIGLRIDGVELGGLDEGRQNSPVLAAAVGSGEQGVLAVQRQRPDGALHGVVVDLDPAIVEEQGEPLPARERIADGLSQLGLLTDGLKSGAEPGLEGLEDRTAVELARRLARVLGLSTDCLLYTSPSPRDRQKSRMPSSA